MIHFVDKVLENLRAYIPLMQTLVWPIAAGLFVLVFRRSIEAILDTIREQIASGCSFEFWLFKLGQLGGASPEERRQKLDRKVTEALTAPGGTQTTDLNEPVRRDIRTSYTIAEILVMNKLSTELGLKIEREVAARHGARFIFDGVARADGKFIAIEVKYLHSPARLKTTVLQSLDRMNAFVTSLDEGARKNFRLIFVVVVGRDVTSSMEDVVVQIGTIKKSYGFPTVSYTHLTLPTILRV